jgi:hypothetical protein
MYRCRRHTRRSARAARVPLKTWRRASPAYMDRNSLR